MSVNYSVSQQSHDFTGNNVKLFYARSQSKGILNFNRLCKRISDRCTATKADVMAALEGCIYVMKEALEDGNIVKLGDFGSFQLSISSKGAENEKDFSSSNITRAKVNFRPGADITELYHNLEFNKVTVNVDSTSATEADDSSAGATSGSTTEAGS